MPGRDREGRQRRNRWKGLSRDRRAIRLDSSADDYERGSVREYLMGKEGGLRIHQPPAHVARAERGVQRSTCRVSLDTVNLSRSPVYIGFEPDGPSPNWNFRSRHHWSTTPSSSSATRPRSPSAASGLATRWESCVSDCRVVARRDAAPQHREACPGTGRANRLAPPLTRSLRHEIGYAGAFGSDHRLYQGEPRTSGEGAPWPHAGCETLTLCEELRDAAPPSETGDGVVGKRLAVAVECADARGSAKAPRNASADAQHLPRLRSVGRG